MNKIKISIIVPVHNTGVYLEESLESIFTQSFQEFEVICVDDASSDKLTREILHRYQCIYENMRVIWLEENIGAGEARNIGFDEAKGEYVIFLDADDVFGNKLLEKMYQHICINNADVCVCGHEEFYVEDGRKCNGGRWMPDKEKINRNDREDWLLGLSTAAWDKLCRTQFLKEKKIYFQSLSSSNDVFFSCRVMINAEKRCCIEEEPLIYYRIKNSSQISANRNPLNLYRAMQLLDKVEQGNKKNVLLKQWISALLLRNGRWELEQCRNEDYKKQYCVLLKDYLIKSAVSFQNKVLEVYAEKFKNESCESQCLVVWTDFLGQLRLTAEKLKIEINGEEQLFLWGLGYRGKIFQQFCKEQDITLCGVADIKNLNVGEKTSYGNEIVNTEYVLASNGLIIACNETIYEYLREKGQRLLNLEEYYLF